MEKHIIKANPRAETEKPKKLRADGYTPANIFGVGASRAIALETKQVDKLLEHVSESTVIYVDLEGKEIPVMFSEIQYDPIHGKPLHLALRQVNLSEKVTAMIPVETTGVFNVPGAYYNLVHDEIEAEGLPTDLPEAFILDLGKLKAVGDAVPYSALEYDRAKITLKIEDETLPVLVVDAIIEETEETETPETTPEATSAETAEKKEA